MVILARILVPEDFGLVGMVTAFTGFLGLFKDAGLSMVTVQRSSINDEQTSTLFWLNMGVGLLLCAASFAIAPVLVSFYHEPRLRSVTQILGIGFLFSAASAQHQALLQRQMRFSSLGMIDIVSQVSGIAVGITMALAGFGYWALVWMTLIVSFANMLCVWHTTSWIPMIPRRDVGIRSMFHFGGTVTVNAVIMYFAYNAEKVLLGRFWGAEALGIYGRAFNLINLPTGQLNAAIGGVAFPALSRLQEDPDRFRNYFLKGYSLFLALTIPITLGCALFADDIVFVLLGPKWENAALIFRLLAPTVLAFAFINPFGWLLWSRGQVGRSLKMALVMAPLIIAAYVAGLGHGPVGVAVGYSTMMTLLIFPMIAWAKHGTSISSLDIFRAVGRPLISGIVGGAIAFGVQFYFGRFLSPVMRLVVGGAVLLVSYLGMLLYAMGQKKIYLDLLQELKIRPGTLKKA